MTWLKLGEEFTVELANLDLSDAAFRTHVEGLAYATDRENDGIFTDREVKRFAESPDANPAAQELIDLGLWQRRADGKIQIIHHMAEQPAAEYLRDKRQVEANRQRRFRETKALEAQGYTAPEIEAILRDRGITPAPSEGKSRKPRSPRDVTRDVTRDTTRDPERNGAERNGAERSSKEALDREASSFASSEVSPSSAQSAQDQAWLMGLAVPVGVDPGKCASPRCGGRVTDYNQGLGIEQCNECLRQGAAK